MATGEFSNVILLADFIGRQIMLNNEEEEEEEAILQAALNAVYGSGSIRMVITKISNYVEYVVPAMMDETFRRHFRLTRSTFSTLIQRLEPILSDDAGPDVCFISVEKQVLIAIWILGNQDSFRDVSDRFDISPSTAHKILMQVVDALLVLNDTERIIAWPDETRATEVQRAYEVAYRFPGVVGAIDGCHIAIKAPEESPASYINRKGFHSVLLQGVCDIRLLFIDCYAGEVGSIHDACMFRRSDLCNRIETTPTMFPNNGHLIGDLAYPLKQTLLTGFRNNGRLTRRQQKYNYFLSSARSTIERAFAVFNGRRRRMKYLNMSKINRIPYVVIACCVLHNICILNDDLFEADIEENEDMVAVPAAPVDADRNEGARKRNNIVNSL